MSGRRWIPVAVLALSALAACSESDRLAGPSEPAFDRGFVPAAGAVYTMSNAAAGNVVLAFDRASDGRLTPAGSWSTGGLGTDASLGNQNGVVLTKDGRWLLVVNAGSNDVSVFGVRPDGLDLVDREPSGGAMPISIAVHDRLVYILNAGGDGGISGFTLSPKGDLSALPGSSRPLGGSGVGPAQVTFSPDGAALVVTEKAANAIVTYAVGSDGRAGAPQSHPSIGTTPFGFAFTQQGTLVVSEAATGSVSSYRLDSDAGLHVVSPAVPTTQAAACWVVITGNSRFAYTTNAGSGTISGYAIGNDGSLSLLDVDGVTGVTGPGTTPLDAAVSAGSRYLYILDGGTHDIAAFAVGPDGSLTSLDGIAGLPATADGLAVK